jgi:hypothetical protein
MFITWSQKKLGGHIMTTGIDSAEAPLSFWNPILTSIKQAAVSVYDYLYQLAQRVVEMAISKFFYWGHKVLAPDIVKTRTQALNNLGAFPLACQNDQGVPIDMMYIPSASAKRTGHAIVLALNSTYVDRNPRHYTPYLDNGADVVLWNQTTLTTTQYAKDLFSVLKALKAHNPDQKLCVHSYCASVDPALSAAAELNDPNVSIVADRGQGDVLTLAKSQTIIARLGVVQQVLKDKFFCDGIHKIRDVPGPIAIIAPPTGDDQCMQYAWGTKNLTHDLHHARQRDGDAFILFQGGDHWMGWNADIHNRVNEFLKENGIIAPDYTPATEKAFPTKEQPSFWQRRIMPLLAFKSPYDC